MIGARIAVALALAFVAARYGVSRATIYNHRNARKKAGQEADNAGT
jgi:transposase